MSLIFFCVYWLSFIYACVLYTPTKTPLYTPTRTFLLLLLLLLLLLKGVASRQPCYVADFRDCLQRQTLDELQTSLETLKQQQQEAESALKNKDLEMAATIQHKETQIIQFLKAVEVKTSQKDQELTETQTRLARTEIALSKLMHEMRGDSP
jgi:hypothetical protein